MADAPVAGAELGLGETLAQPLQGATAAIACHERPFHPIELAEEVAGHPIDLSLDDLHALDARIEPVRDRKLGQSRSTGFSV